MYGVKIIYNDEGGFFDIDFSISKSLFNYTNERSATIVAENEIDVIQKTIDYVENNKDAYTSEDTYEAQLNELRIKLRLTAARHIVFHNMS